VADADVILITGATGGLGEPVVLALVSRRQEALEALAAELGLAPDRMLCIAADLTRPEEAERAVEAVLARWDRIDCLLNLVGKWQGRAKVADVTDAQWHGLLATNLHSAFYITRAVLPAMLSQRYGRIVHIGSRAVERAGESQVVYNVSKAALESLARSVARDYGAQGIRANTILAGTIATARRRDSMPDADTSQWVWPEHLAQLMLLLCGPAGADINGAAIPVYGP
jgi:NAD(P)-dependent dehydrogenase (short-subunit alcohol dehydrogenase family)